MYPPGLRLRQTRETLGLTYRDVERASYEIALKRGRPEFVLHISRLADFENRNVVPSLHKLYSLAAIYHEDPFEIANWYEAPFRQTFQDGANFPPPRTHLSDTMPSQVMPTMREGSCDSSSTGLLNHLPAAVGHFPGPTDRSNGHYRYGQIGMSDRRMVPLLRPGSLVRVDTNLRQIDDSDWFNEYDRPMYFVELRGEYRCGWFQKERTRLIMQPHVLSHCPPEAWRTPEEAEVVGRVVGVVTYLNEPWAGVPSAVHTTQTDSSRKAL